MQDLSISLARGASLYVTCALQPGNSIVTVLQGLASECSRRLSPKGRCSQPNNDVYPIQEPMCTAISLYGIDTLNAWQWWPYHYCDCFLRHSSYLVPPGTVPETTCILHRWPLRALIAAGSLFSRGSGVLGVPLSECSQWACHNILPPMLGFLVGKAAHDQPRCQG